jgi:ABC-2 type transport system permease protein
MTKALFKKQMMEVFAWLYKDRKTGKLRSAQSIALYAILYLFLFGYLAFIFYFLADTLCESLIAVDIGWLYWCLMGLISLFFGVFGSVFSTYSSLYQAKDNDFLLSLPLPASRILFVRLFGVYIMGLMYELIVMVPTVLVWFVRAPFSPVGAICAILIPFVLSVLVLVLSAILGWGVALIAGRLKHKNIITVFICLAFIAVYYYAYSQAYSMLQALLLNAESVGDKMKTILYPLYHMGLAAEGNILSMLIFTAIICALLLIVYLVLSHSFIGLATANRGSAKVKYKEKNQKTRSVGSALFQKELRRFIGSSNYMLNCGLGIIFMPIAAVLIVWKAGTVQEYMSSLVFLQDYFPLFAIGAICMIATMNDMTAPSVSLEGKNIWLVQSLPISSKQVLTAKLKLHLVLTLIPAIPLIAAVEWLIKPAPIFAVLIPITTILFVVLMAVLGLCVNLKMPNLNWTSEIVPIKQSLCVMIALFGGWAIILVLAGLYVLLDGIFNPMSYLFLACSLLLALSLILLRWLFTKGAKIFSTL